MAEIVDGMVGADELAAAVSRQGQGLLAAGVATGVGEAGAPDLDDPHLYVNRELSLLSFFERVLEEAQDERNKLLERVKFLAIVASNLAEFFMVRVAGLKEQIEAGVSEVSGRRHDPGRAAGTDPHGLAGPDGSLPRVPGPLARAAPRRRYPRARLRRTGRQPARRRRRLLQRDRLPGADAAGRRSGTALSPHLEHEPERGGILVRRGRRRAVRPGQGARYAPAARSGPAAGGRARERSRQLSGLARSGGRPAPRGAVPGDGDSGARDVPGGARRRDGDPGTRGRGPARDRRARRAQPALRFGGAADGRIDHVRRACATS